ncbi:hypothetical protein GOZ90_24580 [Agrobacterium vitis]|uniref:Uncharacterized protein n=1 Tax=Agrobacterium vitis TaxID=373 RepID=A0A6L6VJV1_AGRVI|nr:hypothetical protein [Agrobacterium vitis]MUZ75846.1 hypothetical protein [Agrobacterium vitis]MVA19407.1 hypothetical protein [Agrobacterium vitis]
MRTLLSHFAYNVAILFPNLLSLVGSRAGFSHVVANAFPSSLIVTRGFAGLNDTRLREILLACDRLRYLVSRGAQSALDGGWIIVKFSAQLPFNICLHRNRTA